MCAAHVSYGQAAGNCDAVKGMYITNVTRSSARLEWAKNPLADGYIYVISKSANPPEKFGKFIKDAGLTEEGLASNATYYAHIRTKCAGTGISQWSTIQFNTPAPYNPNMTVDNSFAFSVYPLQADKSITIKIKGSNEQVASVWIQDMYGAEIGYYPLIGDRLHVDIATLNNGIYYICYNDFYGRLQWTRFTKTSSRVLNDH
jgi:hypothetical protein